MHIFRKTMEPSDLREWSILSYF